MDTSKILLTIIRIFIFFVHGMQEYFGIHVHGVGRVLRLIRKPCEISVDGIRIYVEPSVASSYHYMMIGKFNEPETHTFVNALLQKTNVVTTVIDVGMNIGEMVLDFARHPSVSDVVGFEPNTRCVDSVWKSVALNGYTNILVHTLALGRTVGTVPFHFSDSAVTSSAVLERDGERTDVPASTLDQEFGNQAAHAIIIIDVEGAELDVVAGGGTFIRRNRPLIIFEYHKVTRTVFALEDMRRELGNDYEIFRLRHDGGIDQNLQETWNCVAVHTLSPWYKPCQSLIVHD